MRFPWSKRETRDIGDYTDAVIAALIAQAGGTSSDDAGLFSLTAAVEICAGSTRGPLLWQESIP